MFIIYADMLNTKATLGTNRLTSFRLMRPHTSELSHREIIFKTAFPLKDRILCRKHPVYLKHQINRGQIKTDRRVIDQGVASLEHLH